jgi:hypothetical protein
MSLITQHHSLTTTNTHIPQHMFSHTSWIKTSTRERGTWYASTHTASRLKTYPCCNRHQAHQHAHFASSGTGLHIGRCPLSILSILIIRSIFQSPNQCLSIWPVALQLESCSTFCPSTRFDCISLKHTNLLDSACKRVYWILRLNRWSYEKAAIITFAAYGRWYKSFHLF